MNTEVLIATMNLKSEEEYEELIKSTKASSNTLTINQITEENLHVLEVKEGKHKLFSFKERGLSKSRNKAISRASGDICIIADNDVDINCGAKDCFGCQICYNRETDFYVREKLK
jgi:glycosyltransferase involved in cell wall biosynthesis